MLILGIDPGLRITGYGCIRIAGGGPELVEAGVFRLGKTTAGMAAATVSARLLEVDADFRALLDRLRPQAVAVEGLFSHYNHPATAIVMGHARGVMLLAVVQAGIKLLELKPTEVKKSLTGYGHADKSQVQRAIQTQFGLAELPSPPDLADALAIALCASQRLAMGAAVGEVARRSRVSARRLPKHLLSGA